MIHDDEQPVYTISIAAELVGVHPRTLRIYEEEGFCVPHRRSNQRMYSQQDVLRIKKVIELFNERHLTVPGVRALFDVAEHFHLEVEKMMDELIQEFENKGEEE